MSLQGKCGEKTAVLSPYCHPVHTGPVVLSEEPSARALTVQEQERAHQPVPLAWAPTCASPEAHSPGPPRLQQGQQHLRPADQAALGLLPVEHVPQKLLHTVLPVGHAQVTAGRTDPPPRPQPSLPALLPCGPGSLHLPGDPAGPAT